MASARLSWGIVGLRMANCRAYSNEFMMPIPEVWLRQTVGVLIYSKDGEAMAEKEGFEPPVEFPPQLISSQSHSATLPLLLES